MKIFAFIILGILFLRFGIPLLVKLFFMLRFTLISDEKRESYIRNEFFNFQAHKTSKNIDVEYLKNLKGMAECCLKIWEAKVEGKMENHVQVRKQRLFFWSGAIDEISKEISRREYWDTLKKDR